MENYVISTCSTFDLTKEYAEKRNIRYINFHYRKDGVKFEDDLYQSVDPHEFYQSMVDGAEMKTSQVNAGEFIEYFKTFLKDGKDIIHLSLSSGKYFRRERYILSILSQHPAVSDFSRTNSQTFATKVIR